MVNIHGLSRSDQGLFASINAIAAHIETMRGYGTWLFSVRDDEDRVIVSGWRWRTMHKQVIHWNETRECEEI